MTKDKLTAELSAGQWDMIIGLAEFGLSQPRISGDYEDANDDAERRAIDSLVIQIFGDDDE